MSDTVLAPDALVPLMTQLRPRLHRYCARMLGSAIDGEDVVQEALAKAAEAFPSAGAILSPESWLFRIAHNTALDALRRAKRHAARRAPGFTDLALANLADPSAAADARIAAAAGLQTFLRLPPAQRAAVILADVLGHSLAETGQILGLTLPATKAALHRARARLRGLAAGEIASPALAAPMTLAERQRLRAYADAFNARQFDTLRALLADDVRLDLAGRLRLAGARDVGVYFTRYSEASDWRLTPGLAEGRPALLVSHPDDAAATPRWAVLLTWAGARIAAIHDYRYAPYVMDDLEVGALRD